MNTNVQVPRSHYDKFGFIPDRARRTYLAMINYLDDLVGDIVARLKRKGMWDNTLIVFSADNGGPIYFNGNAGANNFPLKGGKFSNWEGGIRANAWASGGFIPAARRGTVEESYIAVCDWYVNSELRMESARVCVLYNRHAAAVCACPLNLASACMHMCMCTYKVCACVNTQVFKAACCTCTYACTGGGIHNMCT